jgi:cGMP-dependent protein kinase
LGRDLIVKILGDGIQVIVLRNAQRWALENSQVFSKLNKIILEKILDCIQIYNYKEGDIIIRKSTFGCQKVLIVMEGVLKANQRLIEKGGIYGDEFFIEENQKNP